MKKIINAIMKKIKKLIFRLNCFLASINYLHTLDYMRLGSTEPIIVGD